MDQLRANLLKAQEVTQAARKKFSGENDMLHELQYQFEAADATRQEAYVHLQSLRKQNYEKVFAFPQKKTLKLVTCYPPSTCACTNMLWNMF